MKKTSFAIIVAFMLSILNYAVNRLELKEINNPGSIAVGDGNLFVYDSSAAIFTYSIKDFKLVNKFGRTGNGPGEFVVRPGIPTALYFYNNQLMIDGITKIVFFSPEGKFLREIKKNTRSLGYFPLGEKFAVKSSAKSAKENFVSFILCDVKDNHFKKSKEFFRFKHPFLQTSAKSFNPLNQISKNIYCRYNKIFVWDEDGVIRVFDDKGNKKVEIKRDYGKQMVTDGLKEKVFEYYKINPWTKIIYDKLKSVMKFPAHFPLIKDVFVADEKIFVFPFAKEKGHDVLFIFDLTGTFLGKQKSPLKEKNVFELYPYTIKDGKVYQLIENLDKEIWEVNWASPFSSPPNL